MKKLAIAMLFSLVLCGCSAAKQATNTPQPQPIPIVQTWTITVANSSSGPSGWVFAPQTVSTQSIPVSPCMTDFDNLVPPDSMTLPSSFGSCAYTTGIPLPQGQSNWLQTIVMGTTTADLYSGEAVSYVLMDNSADGTTSVVLGGNGTFTSTTTVENGTTNFSYTITGQLNCLSFNNSTTDAACAAWHTTFTANLGN
jgi:hypothetical protein